ncbi:MAG TPA: hypothetical protein VFG10_11680 [Saprospiraceae bacterium]|nr:hypothetical protein [Saprospiraceae bacterium]
MQFLLSAFLLLFILVHLNKVVLTSINQGKDLKITVRNDGTACAATVRESVSKRDNIPVEQILTCYYYGQTTQGYFEYRFTTMYNGPGVYYVGIIGDCNEGF